MRVKDPDGRDSLCSRSPNGERLFAEPFVTAFSGGSCKFVVIFPDFYYLGSYDAADCDADHRGETDLDSGLQDKLAVPLDVQVLAQQVRAPRALQQSLTPYDTTAVQLGETAVSVVHGGVHQRRFRVVDRRLLVSVLRPGPENGQERERGA